LSISSRGEDRRAYRERLFARCADAVRSNEVESRIHWLTRKAHAPPAGRTIFAEHVSEAVLRGYTAFSSEDAHRAAARLLDQGPPRIKLASAGIGGQAIRNPARSESLRASRRD